MLVPCPREFMYVALPHSNSDPYIHIYIHTYKQMNWYSYSNGQLWHDFLKQETNTQLLLSTQEYKGETWSLTGDGQDRWLGSNIMQHGYVWA